MTTPREFNPIFDMLITGSPGYSEDTVTGRSIRVRKQRSDDRDEMYVEALDGDGEHAGCWQAFGPPAADAREELHRLWRDHAERVSTDRKRFLAGGAW